jgi:hypothetical protein
MRLISIIAFLALLIMPCIAVPALAAVPQLTDEQKELAISSIEGYSEVQDAAINQDGKQLSLAIIVGYATNEETAKDLGDSFVRLVKSFGPEDTPEKEIGPGLYDYLIGVYYPDKSQVALGAKCSSCRKITW